MPADLWTAEDVELVADATEQHYIADYDTTDAMGNHPCVCGKWWDAAGDNPGWDQHMAEVAVAALAEAGRLANQDQSAAEARVRTQVAAEALINARDELAKVAERLEAKGREPGGKLHLGTAAGVRLACFRLIELADQVAAEPTGTPKEPTAMTSEITWTVTAPYRQCTECRHTGPPVKTFSVTICQPWGADQFHLIPHRADCSAPNPFNGPSATITFNDQSAIADAATGNRRRPTGMTGADT